MIDTTDMNCMEGDLDTLIAELYSRVPKNTGDNRIIPLVENIEDLSDGERVFIFEMLLNFYTEGLNHYMKLKVILEQRKNKEPIDSVMFKELIINNMYDTIDVNYINKETLLIAEEWIKSIGFGINIVEEDYEWYLKMVKEEDYIMSNPYCKILLKENAHDEPYFNYMNITKPYHFVINGDYKNTAKNIKDIYALLILNINTPKVYRISFMELNFTNFI